MTTVQDIYDKLCEKAPLDLQMSFDNSGFLFGRASCEVNKVLLVLDVTSKVVDEAISMGVQLIISHHPVIFNPLKCITDEKLLRLAENSIAVISMHTNLDIAHGGVNDVLLSILGAEGGEALDQDGCGRIGHIKEAVELGEFLELCKQRLNTKGLRYYDAGRKVHKIAVMGGAGGDFVQLAYDFGCDTYITSDIKYNRFLEAEEIGINLIDADHFCTENPVIPVLCNYLSASFPDTEFFVSKIHGQIVSFF